MKINFIALSCSNISSFFQTKSQECVDFVTWIFFRLSLLWDPTQREEYRLFFEIKHLSVAEKSPQMILLFKEKILALSEKISDESIVQHLKRLNVGELRYQPYFHTTGNEKACIRAHEVFEMLSMKWERGVPFDRDRFSTFWPAHTQAIHVENIFLQALAMEKGIILSTQSLEYCRIYDDLYLDYPMQFSAGSLDLVETEKNLTKKIEAIPNSSKEIDCYCQFFSQYMDRWSPRKRIGICQRYLFSQLSRHFSDKKLYLITLLRALEKEEVYHTFPLETLLVRLRDHLQNFNLPQYWDDETILKEEDFFRRDADYIPFAIREHYTHLKDSF